MSAKECAVERAVGCMRDPVNRINRINRINRTVRAGVLVLATAIGSLCASFVQAQELVDTITTPWSDPLFTRPPVLDFGKVLPGDTAVALCPQDTTAMEPLSLAQAVDLALCHNPQIQGSWAMIKVQAAALGEARATYLPTVTLGTSRITGHTGYPGSDIESTTLHSTTVNGNLNWRLFDFGGRDANRRSATALLNAALSSHDAALQKTLASVVAAYFEAQTAQAMWTARQKSEALARQTLESARRRESRGAGAQSDTLRATASLAKAALEKSRAKGADQKARAVLVYALGLPMTTRLTLADDLVDETDSHHQRLAIGEGGVTLQDSARQDLNDWLIQAQERHPALLAARAQLESAYERVTSTRAEGLPSLDLTGNVYRNGRPNQALSPTKTQEVLVGVTLNIPIFDGFARTYKVRGAQAQVEQKKAELRDTEHQVLLEVVKAHAEARAAFENLVVSEELLNAAEQALQTVQRKFDKGATDLLEMLDTQAALSDAWQERIRCLAEWSSSRLRLLANAGELGRQAIAP